MIPKYKVGDVILDLDPYENNYSAVITQVTDTRYIYDIYDRGIWIKNYSYGIRTFEEFTRLQTKLEKSLI